jgi:hypothetical protein
MGLYHGFKRLINKMWKLKRINYKTKHHHCVCFILPKLDCILVKRNWTNVKKSCQNILTTTGRLGPSLLWRLDFNNFIIKKHFLFSALWKTRIFIILASFKYSSKLWHNIHEDEIVCRNHRNHVKGLPSKGSCMTFVVRLFIVILKSFVACQVSNKKGF